MLNSILNYPEPDVELFKKKPYTFVLWCLAELVWAIVILAIGSRHVIRTLWLKVVDHSEKAELR